MLEEDSDFLEHLKVSVTLATGIKEEEMQVVWFTKTLQNAKAIIAVKDPNSRMLYEAIYDGNKSRSYVDCYEKQDNIVVRHNW